MNNERCAWLSTPKYTVCVDINKYGIIKNTDPVCKWMHKQNYEIVITKLINLFNKDKVESIIFIKKEEMLS